MVFEWISLNAAAIVEYWDCRIDTIELGQLLRRLPSKEREIILTPKIGGG